MKKAVFSALVALAIASFGLVACGGDEDSTSTAAESTVSTPAGEGGGSALDVAADPGGALAFTETELTAEPGSATVNFDNESTTPHNVYIEDGEGNVLAETETITGSSTSTTAELEPGTFTYFCDVPGHREAGMEGTLTVE